MTTSELTDRAILHVDMDAFFVSVELLDHPELRGRPVIVGGDGTRGVVAAASYEARVFGIHSAMSSQEARRRCPGAVFLRGRHSHYAAVSGKIMGILKRFADDVEPISLDEAFLDVTGSRLLRRPYRNLGDRIRAVVHDEVGLTCSVGIGPSKLVAKLASESAKPKASRCGPQPGAGVVVVEPHGVLAFLDPLPIGDLWGVGPVTEKRLAAVGVCTIGDLARIPREAVVATLGQTMGDQLLAMAKGLDSRTVVSHRRPKSIGHEETFSSDLHRKEAVKAEAIRLTDAVATRLRARGLAGRTVSLKVRFGDFRTITRSRTVQVPLDSAKAIAREVNLLWEEIDPSLGVRLIGVSVSGLLDSTHRQLTLDDQLTSDDRVNGTSNMGRDRALDDVVDRVRRRFGSTAIAPAVTVGPDGPKVKRTGDRQWGPNL